MELGRQWVETCGVCGSTRVEFEAMVDPNRGEKVISYTIECGGSQFDTFCNRCEEYTHSESIYAHEGSTGTLRTALLENARHKRS